MRYLLFLIFGSISLLLAATAAATPIQIEADRMESVEGTNAILFTGQVVAQQQGLTVYSDEMTVHYFSDEEQAALADDDQRRLKKLFATGNVRIESDDFSGTGQRMDYFEVERVVHLSGNARAWQEGNLVTGDKITMYLDEGKSIAEYDGKSDQRVRAFFFSADNGNDDPAPAPAGTPPTPADPPTAAEPQP